MFRRRGPGAAVATAGFLTIAFAVALLAEGYRATLSRADREQAAFQVPHEIVVVDDGSDRCTLRFFTFYPAMQKSLAVGQRVRLRHLWRLSPR